MLRFLISARSQPLATRAMSSCTRKIAVQTHVPPDIEIAQSVTPVPIQQVASAAGILPSELSPYGSTKAKVNLSVLSRLADCPRGKLVVVAGVNPTALGEGKSTTTVGLGQALGAHLGHRAFVCIRQPSQGPTFGIKGGAAGGGYAQVVPMEDFNLHLTGDIHAVASANNLLAAAVDARAFHEATQSDAALFRRLCSPGPDGTRTFARGMYPRLRKLGIAAETPDQLTDADVSRFVRLDIDPSAVLVRRVIDVNDRFLRSVTTGQSPTEKGQTRSSGFDIAVASELMAILALATGLRDLRARLGRIAVARDRAGGIVTADDLGIAGALAVLLRDAVQPNLLQTLEGTPALVHAGPFANIASGNSSVLADQVALALAGENGFAVTEAGFGSEIGLEKFVHLKCRAGGLMPAVVVIVATVRALKLHGGGPPVRAGAGLPDTYRREDVGLVERGCANLERHVRHAGKYGVPVVVCVNRFKTDADAETEVVLRRAKAAGAFEAVVANHWAEGGAGAVKLAEAVVRAGEAGGRFRFLYEDDATLREKVRTVAVEAYGAKEVEFAEEAGKVIDRLQEDGFGGLPVCIAKTQYSLSADPAATGAPTGFALPVREVRLSAGAGFVLVICGKVQTMPGLPTRPAYYDIDLDMETGRVIGLM